jgi:hypothetical protein
MLNLQPPVMKRLLFFILLLHYLPVFSQTVTVNDLVAITSLSDKKLSAYVTKLGFVPASRNMDDGATISEFFFNNKKDPTDTVLRYLSGLKKGKITGSIYETSSFTEFQVVLKSIRRFGFISGNPKEDSLLRADSTRIDSVSFFQKEDMTIRTKEEMRDDVKVFKLSLEKRPVPTGSSVRYADDLLLFDSHESLVALFGAANVKRDMYYFSQTDSSRCSVLFPNSNRQAIFIWEDQPNDRTISFLMIGGGLRAESSSDFNQSVALNTWRSYSGLYTGMRLQEIVKANEADFSFYGKASEFAFMVTPEQQQKGNIDFKKTGISLGCFNCNGTPLVNKEKVSAEAAIDTGLQLYILSIVFLP